MLSTGYGRVKLVSQIYLGSKSVTLEHKNVQSIK